MCNTLVSHGVDAVGTYLARGGRVVWIDCNIHLRFIINHQAPPGGRGSSALASSLCVIFEDHSLHHSQTTRLSVQINPNYPVGSFVHHTHSKHDGTKGINEM